MDEANTELRELVAGVAAAYFESNHVSPQEIPRIIAQIASSLEAVGKSLEAAPAPAETTSKATPAQIRKSITPEALISFEDGKAYKTLKRHLTIKGLSAAEYKEKWGLPKDYPMTAPSYSARRSELAKSLGLGRKVAVRPGRKRAVKPT